MIAKKYLKKVGGFTLVELLIVIAILAIIALIVIAAINPIEQANRARDTGMKADGSQMVSAIDRYFTARFEFPWSVQEPITYNTDSSFGFWSAGEYLVGLCAHAGGGVTDCLNDGVLIETNELKPEFRNRNFIDAYIAGEVEDQLMVGKTTGSSASMYVCYIPMSNANRDRACDDGNVFTLETGLDSGVRNQIPAGDDSCASDSTAWVTSPPGEYYVCVPE